MNKKQKEKIELDYLVTKTPYDEEIKLLIKLVSEHRAKYEEYALRLDNCKDKATQYIKNKNETFINY